MLVWASLTWLHTGVGHGECGSFWVAFGVSFFLLGVLGLV